jgi:hypothetical protein
MLRTQRGTTATGGSGWSVWIMVSCWISSDKEGREGRLAYGKSIPFHLRVELMFDNPGQLPIHHNQADHGQDEKNQRGQRHPFEDACHAVPKSRV